jgi:hypothetical protein
MFDGHFDQIAVFFLIFGGGPTPPPPFLNVLNKTVQKDFHNLSAFARYGGV